jgi:hypothetical protein
MLYASAVNAALRRDGPRLAELAQQQAFDVSAFERGLSATAGLTADEIERRVEGIPWPGARPSEEHARASGWFLHFAHGWTNHRQALEWSHQLLRGITTVSVDGSEIKPTNEYNLRIGAVQVLTYENHHGGGYVKLPRFELVLPDRGDVSLRRFVAETEALIYAIERVAGREPAPVVLFDGTLVLSFTSEMHQELAARYVNAILEVLRASARHRVPLVGYVDASDAKDLCVLLSHLEGTASPRDTQVTDAAVLARHMSWGDRTKALVCARDDRVLPRYRGAAESEQFQRELCFVYLKTTGSGPPARLDIPRWVVREREVLDHVVDVIRAEAVVGNGYPLALSTADRGAVLRGKDRELFYRALERYADAAGGQLRQSAKATSKRRRRV